MIETERLILRAPEPRDRAALHAMWADPRVMADLGPVKDGPASDAALARHASYAPLGFQAVERRADGATIGFCGLKPGAPDTPIADLLEVGWMLAQPYWGAGYAHEAAAASIAHGFATRPDDAIVAITSARNAKSQVLMTRLGMHHVRALDFDHPMFAASDPLRASVVYRIDRP